MNCIYTGSISLSRKMEALKAVESLTTTDKEDVTTMKEENDETNNQIKI